MCINEMNDKRNACKVVKRRGEKRHTRSGRDVSPHRGVWRWLTGNCVRVSASGGGDAFEGIADGFEVDLVEVIE